MEMLLLLLSVIGKGWSVGLMLTFIFFQEYGYGYYKRLKLPVGLMVLS